MYCIDHNASPALSSDRRPAREPPTSNLASEVRHDITHNAPDGMLLADNNNNVRTTEPI